MQSFEYKFYSYIHNGDLNKINTGRLSISGKPKEPESPSDIINAFGAEGWELVSVTSNVSSSSSEGKTDSLLFSFKRPQGKDEEIIP